MHRKTVNLFRSTSHVMFILISMALTVLLFQQLAVGLLGKIIFVSMGIALELVKVYLFLFVKYNYRMKGIGIIIGTLYLILYISLAAISGVASLGFVLNEMGEQSFSATASNIDSENIMKDIAFIEQEIETKVRQQSELPHDWITASDRYSRQIKELRDEGAELVESLDEATSKRQLVTADTFTLIGSLEWVDKTGEEVLFGILMSLVILLEIVIALTSGTIYDSMPSKIQFNKGVSHEGAMGSSKGNRTGGLDSRRIQKTGLHVQKPEEEG